MGPLFIPPLIVNTKVFNFDLKKVKRVYFQFFFDTSDGNKRFRLIAYAIGEKRKPNKDYKPIKLSVDKKKLEEKPNDYFFPKKEEVKELFLGHLELSNVQLGNLLIKGVEFLSFEPREKEINPFCIVYVVTNGDTSVTTETANPCPPAIPPKDDAGET